MVRIQRSTHLFILFVALPGGDRSARRGHLYYEGTFTLLKYSVSNLHNVAGLALDMPACISSSPSRSVALTCYIFHYLPTVYIHCHCNPNAPCTRPSQFTLSPPFNQLHFSLCVCNQASLHASVILAYYMSGATY